MGCASSTPMVATAGSEMLKAATHVRQKGEAVVEDASQALTTGLETAKENVGSAVAGITNELGNAFKEGTQVLDEAKHKVMEGLHLETPLNPGEPEVSSSRAPTPQLQADADSLKTSTPEPEIERALANEEASPPSPKPSLQEMAQLSAEVSQVEAAAPAAAEAPAVDPAPAPAATAAPEPPAPVEARKVRRRFVELKQEEQRRPNTTEWEKFADQLAKSKKFKPYESFGHGHNKFSVYQDHTSLRDKPNHYDGHFSDGNSLSSASQSDLSSGHVTPAPARKGQRDFAKFVGSEQPASVSRSNSRLSNPGGSRTFDFNPHRDRISLPAATRSGTQSRIGSGIQRAPLERISGWGRGRPSVLPEEPGYAVSGRRLSLGLVQQPLRPEREKFVPTGRSRAVQPLHSKDEEKLVRKLAPKSTASRESSYLEFDSVGSDKSRNNTAKAAQSRQPSYTDFDSLQKDKTSPRLSRGSTYTDFSSRMAENTQHFNKNISLSREPTSTSLRSSKNPLMVEKSLAQEKLASRVSSYTDLSSVATDKTPLMPSRELSNSELSSVKSPLKVEKAGFKSRQPSPIEIDSIRASKTPQRALKSYVEQVDTGETHQSQLPQRMLSPGLSPEPESLRNQNQTSMPLLPQKADAPEAVESATPIPPPLSSRVSSAKSSGSNSSLDVIIQPMSSLNTPSIKSFSQSPDQLVMEGYDDSDLEAALARLEILRGSNATLQSLRSCSPGRHTYTASLLSSRRTSPWVMRKSYGGSVAGKENKPSALARDSGKAPQPSHQTLERCDICSKEFVLN
ncbi:hypothetical protein KR018_010246 [Drosophila ironensis]|nr:hypothetical protein KR018_010246 [Drosophila ironensis]